MVRSAGFEPARLSALPPEDSVSANSTTSASDDGMPGETRTPIPEGTRSLI